MVHSVSFDCLYLIRGSERPDGFIIMGHKLEWDFRVSIANRTLKSHSSLCNTRNIACPPRMAYCLFWLQVIQIFVNCSGNSWLTFFYGCTTETIQCPSPRTSYVSTSQPEQFSRMRSSDAVPCLSVEFTHWTNSIGRISIQNLLHVCCCQL